MTVEEVCREFGIAESTWARWLSQYGGMKADDAKRLKELEGENAPARFGMGAMFAASSRANNAAGIVAVELWWWL